VVAFYMAAKTTTSVVDAITGAGKEKAQAKYEANAVAAESAPNA